MSIDFPTEVKGFPFFPIEFDKKARLVDGDQTLALDSFIKTGGVTDLLVLAHGWNNDEAQAMSLYKHLLSNISKEVDDGFEERTVAVVGVFWPSKKFAEADLIAGGATAFGDDLPADELVAQLEAMRVIGESDEDDATIDRLIELVPILEDKKSARIEFGEKVRTLLGTDIADDAELADEIPTTLFMMAGDQMLEELGLARDEEADAGAVVGGIAAVGGLEDGDGDPIGGIAGLGSFFSGIRSGAGNALNMITYYKMKARAGTVGRRGLAPALREVKEEVSTIKIHLVGHSFGGRLVAAAALGESSTATVLPVDSMTLLQAAFSHNGFAEDWDGSSDGYFRDVYAGNRIIGPTLVTYTSNDNANRVAYPLASRLARQTAAAFGDANDRYGAIGANGAQSTPETVAGSLLSRDSAYGFDAGVIYNLEGSDYIDSHGDVAGREIANAIVAAVNAT
jgi:hypothetical protein